MLCVVFVQFALLFWTGGPRTRHVFTYLRTYVLIFYALRSLNWEASFIGTQSRRGSREPKNSQTKSKTRNLTLTLTLTWNRVLCGHPMRDRSGLFILSSGITTQLTIDGQATSGQTKTIWSLKLKLWSLGAGAGCGIAHMTCVRASASEMLMWHVVGTEVLEAWDYFYFSLWLQRSSSSSPHRTSYIVSISKRFIHSCDEILEPSSRRTCTSTCRLRPAGVSHQSGKY